MKTIEILEERIAECVCNRCKGPMLDQDHSGGDMPAYGLHADVAGGYGSSALADMTVYHFDLCEKCCCWLFTQFQIPVVIDEHMPGYADDEIANGRWLAWELSRALAVGRGEKPAPFVPQCSTCDVPLTSKKTGGINWSLCENPACPKPKLCWHDEPPETCPRCARLVGET